MKNFSSFLLSVALYLFSTHSYAASLVGPNDYTGHPNTSTYNLQPVVSAQDVNSFYKFKIKNADGLDHVNDKNYIKKYRVDSLILTVNGITKTTASNFNDDTKYLEFSTKLNQTNSIVLKVEGQPHSFVNLEIEKIVPVDTTAPVVTFDKSSNSTVNSSILNITVNDASNTTTIVWINNQQVANSTLKNFSVNLIEGLNQISIKSTDAYNNSTGSIYINNVKVDTIAPNVTSVAPESGKIYYTNQLPLSIPFLISYSEPIQQGSIDNFVSLISGSNSISSTLNISNSGQSLINVHAFDFAHNEKATQVIYNVVFDNTKPVVAIGQVTNLSPSSVRIPVTISDVNSCSTIVKVNGVQITTSNLKSFSFDYQMQNEGNYTVEIISTDIAGNIGVVPRLVEIQKSSGGLC